MITPPAYSQPQTSDSERLRAFIDLMGAMPPVKSDEMLNVLARLCRLPPILGHLALRVWGFLHPIPYLLKDESAQAEAEDEDPMDAFMRVYADMPEKARKGLSLWVEKWHAEQCEAAPMKGSHAQ